MPHRRRRLGPRVARLAAATGVAALTACGAAPSGQPHRVAGTSSPPSAACTNSISSPVQGTPGSGVATGNAAIPICLTPDSGH